MEWLDKIGLKVYDLTVTGYKLVFHKVVFPFVDKNAKQFCPKLRESYRNVMVHPGKRSGRPMAYPYTITAKLIHFPYKFYFNKGWVIKYYFVAIVFAFPFFYKIQRLSYAKSNVERWKKIREEWYGPRNHHHHHH